jgi:proteasome lid subunit RPN8/RPN11
MNSIGKKLLSKVKNFSLSSPEVEVCGLIIESGGLLSLVPCVNEHSLPELAFRISARKFLSYRDIRYVYHSHPRSSSIPSSRDKRYADELGVPFLIYSVPDDNFNLYKNKVYNSVGYKV